MLVLFQSAAVLERPLCLLACLTAIDAEVPIVALNCADKGYDFTEAKEFMRNLDTRLPEYAVKELNVQDVDLTRAAQKLHDYLPNIISINFDPSGSTNAKEASVLDLLGAIMRTERRASLRGASASVASSKQPINIFTRWRKSSSKKFAVFLSHHKAACAMEARFIKAKLEARLCTKDIFLDSDDLQDLRQLLDHVRDSAVIVLFLSSGLLQRPWCLLELLTAIDTGVPIVGLNCAGKGFDPMEAKEFMMHLDTRLPESAAALLEDSGVNLVKASFDLSSILPNIITVTFRSSGSKNAQDAAVLDLLGAIMRAEVPAHASSFEDWLELRKKASMNVVRRGSIAAYVLQHGRGRAPIGMKKGQIMLSAC